MQEVPGSNPGTDPKLIAFVPERSKGLDSSSSVFVLVGSNPIECIFFNSDGLVGSLLGCMGSSCIPRGLLSSPLLLMLLDHFTSQVPGCGDGLVSPLMAWS